VVSDFVLEIGAEDIPPSYVEPAYRQLADDAEAMLADLRLPWEEIYATGTARRIVLLVSGLADEQESAEETVTGPPLSKGYNEDGTPTKAAEGFARSRGVDVSELRTIPTPRGDVLGFTRRLESRRAFDLLAEHIGGLITALRFPKTMKWNRTGARFARPVRWIVCLYGDQMVPVSFAGVESGRVSYRRPWYAGERVRVRSAATYLADVGKLGIVVDDDRRKKRIWELATRAASRSGLVAVRDEGLLDELTFLVEDPRAFVGQFDRSYLDLPSEVVTTAMRSHQRYIALTDTHGRLVPTFVSFTEGTVRGMGGVRRGNEKVLRARLADAQFYWREDLKRGVDGLAQELNRIVFIDGLGSVGQKSDRIKELARYYNEHLAESRRRPVDLIDRAAALAKADLASEMIKDGKEFTLLQGRIGSHYAAECGEEAAVATAVEQHYWPRTPADPLPDSAIGAAVGVADRIDTICGCFLAGLIPSGSQDPYALRRQANGLLRIVEQAPEIRIDRLVQRSLELYVREGVATQAAADDAAVALAQFFKTRCEAFLKERGISYDVVSAVSEVTWPRPGVALIRARGIARTRGDARFERLITGVKRVGNILSDDKRTYGGSWPEIRAALEPPHPVDATDGFSPAAFTEPAEHTLYEAVIAVIPQMIECDRRHDFAAILDILSGLADPIDRYFDEVLVNCEDPALRDNRHRFLAAVFSVFSRYADFSFIVESGDS
jgi:glycyl-tRNA synthetase beta chain